MRIIIKGLHNFHVPDDLKAYIQERVANHLTDLKEPTLCEVVCDDSPTRGAENKYVHINVTSPHIKAPVHIELGAKNFYAALDSASDKLARALHHAKR